MTTHLTTDTRPAIVAEGLEFDVSSDLHVGPAFVTITFEVSEIYDGYWRVVTIPYEDWEAVVAHIEAQKVLGSGA